VVATFAYLVASLRYFPTLRGHYLPDRSLFRPLLAYGGWVTVSNFITPLLAYVDRFFIGSDYPHAKAITAPYEAVNRAGGTGYFGRNPFPAFTNLDMAAPGCA
jgi:hypothetical protein